MKRTEKNRELYAQIKKESDELKFLYDHRGIVYDHMLTIRRIDQMKRDLEKGCQYEIESL